MNDAASFGPLDGPEAGGNSPMPPTSQSPRVSGGGGRGNGRRKLVKGRGGGRQRRAPRPKQTFINNPVEYLEDNTRGGRAKSQSGPLQSRSAVDQQKLMSKTYGVALGEDEDDVRSLPRINPGGGGGGGGGGGNSISGDESVASGSIGSMSNSVYGQSIDAKSTTKASEVDSVLQRLDESFRLQQMEQQAIMRRAFRFARSANAEQLHEMHQRIDQQIDRAGKTRAKIKHQMKQKLVAGTLAERELAALSMVPKIEMNLQVSERELDSYIHRPEEDMLRVDEEEGEIVALSSRPINIGTVFDEPPELDPELRKHAVVGVIDAAKEMASATVERTLNCIRLDTTVKRLLWLAADQSAHHAYTTSDSQDPLSEYHEGRRHDAEKAVIKLRQERVQSANKAYRAEEHLKKAQLQVLEAEADTKKNVHRALEAEDELKRLTRRALEAEADVEKHSTRSASLEDQLYSLKKRSEQELQEFRSGAKTELETLKAEKEAEIENLKLKSEAEVRATADKLYEEMDKLKVRVRELETESDRANRKRLEAEEEIENTKTLCSAKLENQREQAQTELERAVTSANAELQRKLNAADEELETTRARAAQDIESLKNRLEGQLSTTTALNDAELSTTKNRHSEELETTRNRLETDLESTRNKYENELSRLNVEFDAFKSRAAAELESEKQQGNSALERMTFRASAAEEELESVKFQSSLELEKTTGQKLEAEEELRRLKIRTAEELERTVSRSAMEVETAKGRADKAEKELQGATEQLADADSEVKKLRREIREVIPLTNQKTSELKSLVTQQNSVLDKLREREVENDEANSERKAQLNGMQDLLAGQRELIEQLQSRESEAKTQKVRAEAERRIQKLETEHEKLQEENQRIKTAHEANLGAQMLMANELQQMQGTNRGDKDLISKLRTETAEQKADLKRIRIVSDSQHTEIERLRAALDENLSAQGMSTAEMHELRDVNTELQQQLSVLSQEAARAKADAESELEGIRSDMQRTAKHDLLEMENRLKATSIETEQKLKLQVAQKEQLRQRCERMRHDHAAEIDELLQDQALQLAIHEQRERELEMHEDEMQSKLMEMAETYSSLKKEVDAGKPPYLDGVAQTDPPPESGTIAIQTEGETERGRHITQSSQTIEDTDSVSKGVQIDGRNEVEMPWDLYSYDSTVKGDSETGRESRMPLTTSLPPAQQSRVMVDEGTGTASVYTSIQTEGDANDADLKSVGDFEEEEEEQRTQPSLTPRGDSSTFAGSPEKSVTIERNVVTLVRPGDEVPEREAPEFDGSMRMNTFDSAAPPRSALADQDNNDMQATMYSKTSYPTVSDEVVEDPELLHDYTSTVVSRVVNDAVTASADNQSLEGDSRFGPLSINRSAPDPILDDGVEPEFRNDYAGARVGRFMDDVVGSVYSELEGSMSIVDGRTATSLDVANVLFFKGSVVVDNKRMCVRAVKNTETGALDLELFDPMIDEVNVLSASAAEWSSAGFESLQGLGRVEKVQMIRWLTHEKLHRLRDRPNKVVYRGTMKSKDSLSLVTAMVSGVDDIDPGMLSLRIFSPVTGVMTKIDAVEADWKESGFGAFADLNPAEQASLVQWLCEQRGYKFLNEASGAITAFKGMAHVDGARLLLKAKMRPTAEHPLQLLFFDAAQDTNYEIQLNRRAWSKIKKDHADTEAGWKAAVLAVCKEHVVWTHDHTDLALRQVTWNLPSVEPTVPVEKEQPEIPTRPETTTTRVSVRIADQLCCLTLRPLKESVEAKLLFLKSARVHVLHVDRSRWAELGFGEIWTSPRDVRRTMCIEFAGMIYFTADGLLTLDERVTAASDGASRTTGRDDMSVVSLGTTTDGKSALDSATVDSSVMSLVSWEGATGKGVHPTKGSQIRDVLTAEGLEISGTTCALRLKLDELSIEVELIFATKTRQLQVDTTRWAQLGFDDIWRSPPKVQQQMMEEFAGMMIIDAETDILKVDEFAKHESEHMSSAADDIQVVMTEWNDTYVQGTLENGDILNVKFDKTKQPDLVMLAGYLEAGNQQPIAATLAFVNSETSELSLDINEGQLSYFGYSDFFEVPEKRQHQIMMKVVNALSVDLEQKRLRIYRHPAIAIPNSSF